MTEWIPFLALASLIIGLFAWLRSDINILRRETNEHFTELHKDIQAIDVRLPCITLSGFSRRTWILFGESSCFL
ncbi:MAG: hypothetical protein OXE42_08185 [Gammaproteobacteria bacterium]|nr:hypothetical protein [Gammaproteobacteria bacterium]